jgi:hypothetical protein
VTLHVELGRQEGGRGQPCQTPCKFRHGHAVCAQSIARDVTALKAVGQDLVHENLAVRDGVYGVPSDAIRGGRSPNQERVEPAPVKAKFSG